MITPGVKRKPEEYEDPENLKELDEVAAGKFRALAARANYLALDRPDIGFASKECCRHMAKPRKLDYENLRRLARYLRSNPRMTYQYPWRESGEITAYVDADFAGCIETRKSTSGGCLLVGGHLIKHWSSTQKTLALSSGESELTGILKGTAEALSCQTSA